MRKGLWFCALVSDRVQKFRPMPGADPAKLVGQEKRYKPSSN